MRLLFVCSLILLLASCNNQTLPVYGIKKSVARVENGKTVIDSIDYTIPAFSFIDQDGKTVDTNTISNKIYVADFFFTSCPSICPKMAKSMIRVYDKYKTNGEVAIISYSIDPVRDSVPRLKHYSQNLDINDSGKWHFVTGNKDSIYNLADEYLIFAKEDPNAPGGRIHDGNFILIDKHRRIRGYYDGTTDAKVDKLLGDIDILLKEK